jgi:hydrogenase maturation protease
MGNEILGDEGVGVHAVRALTADYLPPDVEVLEVGTAILDVLPALQTPQRLIIIDAMQGPGGAGSVYRTTLEECSGSPLIASMHGFDIFRVLALAGRKDLPQIVVFGVEPAVIDWTMELSPAVQAAIPHLLDFLRDELAAPPPPAFPAASGEKIEAPEPAPSAAFGGGALPRHSAPPPR